jgi:hypothetical protein
VVLGLELQALFLLGRHSTTSTTPPAKDIFVFLMVLSFELRTSHSTTWATLPTLDVLRKLAERLWHGAEVLSWNVCPGKKHIASRINYRSVSLPQT